MATLRELALARRKQLKLEPVPMDSWEKGAVAYVREVSQREFASIRTAEQDDEKAERPVVPFSLRIILMAVVDSDGTPIFQTYDEIADLPIGDVMALTRAATRGTGLVVDDAEKKAIEKNS